jgi:iron-sulfur cluster protein
MQNLNNYVVHPKEVADKSSKEALIKALKLALDAESDSVRLNTQTFNSKRYITTGALEDYEELKNRARQIKEHSIRYLPSLIDDLTRAIEARGGKVFVAKTKEEATGYIQNVCKRHNAQRVVKAKSITSEEIELNKVLENIGIEVSETDLAEFILQISKEQPSHMVAPAIHRSRETISELFKKNFKTDRSLETGEELTEFARDTLREKFLSADIGISGANLISAKEGSILLVESEGNIRLTTQVPSVHISIAGIEKIIPSKKDFGTFIELLAASGTGQKLTSYTNILQPPLDSPVLNFNGGDDKEREFHLVLIDNGRLKMRDDNELREALYCIRCSACMNVCANFQAVGGHAFGGECYTGGIGGAWTVGTTDELKKGRFAELCTGCSRLNTTIKNRLIKSGEPSFQKQFFANFSKSAKLASLVPSVSNWIMNLPISKSIFETIIGFDKRRHIPKFANNTLTSMYKKHAANSVELQNRNKTPVNLVLFADVYTQYNNPEIGMAIVKVYEKFGLPLTLSNVMEDGRAAQSQGLIETAEKHAVQVAAYLGRLIDEGNEIIFAEPSVLAMVRHDYGKLLKDEKLFSKLMNHTYDAIEYLNKLVNEKKIDLQKIRAYIKQNEKNVFYHGHCQMKSIGIGSVVPEFFKKLGFDVDVSNVECCGMAGSFGYKKDYYNISKNVGQDLVSQIKISKSSDKETPILASGTSCREQISDEFNQTIYHPALFLNHVIDQLH